MAEEYKSGYGSKRPLWQWIAIYAVIGIVVYGLIYYFVFSKKGNTIYSPTPAAPTTNTQASSSGSVTSQNEVQIKNFSFTPATLTIKVGDSVTWINQDSIGHSATADDNSFDTGVFSPGQSKTVTFSKTGTFAYHCTIHSTMTGTIIVQ